MKYLWLFFAAAVALHGADWREVNGASAVWTGQAVALDDHASIFLGRLRLPDGGTHPGTVINGVCSTPYKGGVVESETFEVAIGAKIVWCGMDWDAASAMGQQGKILLYFCRAPMRIGGVLAGWAYGKAYHSGGHANLAYMAWNGREIELSGGFDLAKFETNPPTDSATALGDRTAAPVKPSYPKVRPSTPEGFALREYVVASYGETVVRLVAYLPLRDAVFPAILDIHGGGWQQNQVEADKPLMERLAQKGFVTALVDYRLAPKAKYPAALYDCKASVRFMRAHAQEMKIDPQRIGVIGGSAGGQLAALLAMTNGVARYEGDGPNLGQSSAAQACVVMSATMDYYRVDLAHTSDFERNFFGQECKAAPQLFRDGSPLYHVRSGAPPTLFLEGEMDSRKVGRAEMQAKLRSLGVETAAYILGGAPHPFWMSHPWIDQTVEISSQFFKQAFRDSAPNAAKTP